MYRIEDEISAIREIQTYLFLIGDEHPERRKVAVDGIYSEQFELSVKEFQDLTGLDPTGEVNEETFDKIYSEYLEVKEKRRLREKHPFGKARSIGDSGEDIYHLNITLRSLGAYYKDLPPVRSEGYFSKATEDAVKFMESLFGVTENGIMDTALYDKIAEELRRNKRFFTPSVFERK